jgi:hypothetical protein
MGGLWLLTCVFNLINHSNVRFYSIINHHRSLILHQQVRLLLAKLTPSTSTPPTSPSTASPSLSPGWHCRLQEVKVVDYFCTKLGDLAVSDNTMSHCHRWPPHKRSYGQYNCIRKWNCTSLRGQMKAMKWRCLAWHNTLIENDGRHVTINHRCMDG